MKIKSFAGALPPHTPSEYGMPVALAQSINAWDNLGFEVGQYLGHKETLCQVSAKRDGEVCLVSWGWVPIAECTTDVEREGLI